MLKKFYYALKTIALDGKSLLVPMMLFASKLDVKQSLFKLTMKENLESTYAILFNANPVVKLWKILSTFKPFRFEAC